MNKLKKCYNCESQMEKGVELIISKGKTIPQKIMKCNKCGKAIVSSDEYEKVRKEYFKNYDKLVKDIGVINNENCTFN